MSDTEFTAYIEGLPPQDRLTVEQALVGLRSALSPRPRSEAEVEGRARIGLMLDSVRRIAHGA